MTEAVQRRRVLLLEQVTMDLMKVEMHLRSTKVAALRHDPRALVEVLEKRGKKAKRWR